MIRIIALVVEKGGLSLTCGVC